MRFSILHSLASCWLLGACSITPLAPIPRPLPEALEWATTPTGGAGAFLGLKTRENLGGGFDDMEFRPGILVTRVVENSPAAQAGLALGDILLKLDSIELDDPETLQALLEGREAQAQVRLEVQRGDTVFAVTLKLGAALEERDVRAEVAYRLDPARSRAAWLGGRGGVVLVASHERAPFPRAGIEVGSVVTAIEGARMHSDRALIRLLGAREPGSSVQVDYEDRQGNSRSASVRLQAQPRRLTEFSIPILGTYRASADGDEASLVLLDLWFISLFRYAREGGEKKLSVLRFFKVHSGIGNLSE